MFRGQSEWLQIKGSTLGVNRGLSSNFWWLRSTNHVKFTEQYDVYREACVSPKNPYKWAKLKFATMNLSQKDSQWSINILTPVKKKVPGAVVCKKGHADSVMRHERTHYYWFLWKSCNCKQCFLLPTTVAIFT